MTADERARHERFLAVEHHLGPSHAETLMAMLPPVGWADVATKHDLAALDERIDLRFASLTGSVHSSIDCSESSTAGSTSRPARSSSAWSACKPPWSPSWPR